MFAEIGLQFARYLHDCDADLRPTRRRSRPSSTGCARATRPTASATCARRSPATSSRRFEPDPNRRAELVVLANLEIGLHEQTRLQPEIGEALDAAATTGDRLSGKLVRRCSAAVVQRGLTRLSRVAITHSFMVLTLPGAVLALGRNLDAPFPEALRTPANAELEELLARFEPAAGALDDCGAPRTGRSSRSGCTTSPISSAPTTRSRRSASAPFTPAQVERIRAGAVPDGEL